MDFRTLPELDFEEDRSFGLPSLGSLVGPLTKRIQDRTDQTPRANRKGTRDLKKVDALVLHQMAFSQGSNNTHYDTVVAHFAILPDGQILQLHPLSAMLWASNGFNARSVAVEFAGNFPDTKGKCWSAKTNGCHRVTPEQIDAGCYLVDHLIREMGLTHVFAHRQSLASRANDPGPDIWAGVGQWAVENRGLSDGGPHFKVDGGKPIPDTWRNWGRNGGTTPELETREGFEPVEESLEAASSESHTEWSEKELQYSIIVSPTSPGDDRFRITARRRRPSTLMFPFNTVCLLERHHLRSTRISRVTGTLIAPQVVLTAKHCLTRMNVPSAAAGQRMSHIVVVPGADLSAPRDRRPARPAGIAAPASAFRVHPTLDFGVIILPKPFAQPTQFMHLRPQWTPGSEARLAVAGYPCDKPHGTMWGHSERIALADVSPTHLHYTIDTCPGHSGSPIWCLGPHAARYLVGVHTSGPARCNNDPRTGKCCPTGAPVQPVPGKNRGVRITCEVVEQILAWCREFRVAGPIIGADAKQFCAR